MEDDDSRADAPCSASGRLDDAAYVLARARGAIVGDSAVSEQHVTVGRDDDIAGHARAISAQLHSMRLGRPISMPWSTMSSSGPPRSRR